MNKIGIYRGTFDPFHRGHQESCLVALSACGLEQVLVIPQTPSYKNPVASLQQRTEVIQHSLKKYSRINTHESAQTKLQPLLESLNSQFPDHLFCIIMGSDTFMTILQWDEIDRQTLLAHTEICIILRENKDKNKLQAFIEEVTKMHGRFAYKVLPAVWSKVSSSVVKSNLEKAVSSGALDSGAYDYIKAQKLYESDSNAS